MRVPATLLLLAAACAPAAARAPASRPASVDSMPVPPALTSWANGAVFYEVFVRSFKDANGDGKGDLAGLIERLDYLNDGNPATDTDLGVDALWLMPVFASPSYHGYDTTDYETVNPDYGTNADLQRLCDEAHKRGMKVIVDLVLNHTSDKHPWFVDSASSPKSPKRDWYVWRKDDPGWGKPWSPESKAWCPLGGAFYYCLFWSGMPDLNFRNPEVRAEAKRLATLWLAMGVDGYRLDATRHLIETGPGQQGQNDTAETHAFLKEFSAAVHAFRTEAVLIGENWTETPIIARYYGETAKIPGGDELALNFDFPLAGRIIGAARQGKASMIAEKIVEMQKTYPPGATWVPFLTNHDMVRVATNLGNDAGKLRVAAAVLLTLPGTPFLYYGEEIGLQNGPGKDDEDKRTPMPWSGGEGGRGFTTGKPWHAFAPGTASVEEQARDPRSLLSHYRALIHARHRSPALRHGRLEILGSDGAVLVYLISEGKERVLVAHNLGDAAQSKTLAGMGAGDALFATDGATLGAAGQLSLPAYGSGIWRLR